MPDILVRPASAADRSVVERLWLMFRHDLSEYDEVLPDADGTFYADRPRAALADADWAAYLLTIDARPAGLALVRGLTGPKRVPNTFFEAWTEERRPVPHRPDLRALLPSGPG